MFENMMQSRIFENRTELNVLEEDRVKCLRTG
jgi:hypothetical protein